MNTLLIILAGIGVIGILAAIVGIASIIICAPNGLHEEDETWV